MQTTAQKVREHLGAGKAYVAPGVYDGISTRCALSAGCEALYMTGAGTVASRLGQADLGINTMDDFANAASNITLVAGSIPVFADADTGFGGPLNVARTMKLYERAGVAGIQLEDQAIPKRCGHLKGKVLCSIEDYQSRIRAAVNARSPDGPIIIARTDALATDGLEEAFKRLGAAFDLGAEVGFLEGIETKEQAIELHKRFPGKPMLMNVLTNGVSPNWSVQECLDIGYKIVLFPLGPATAAMLALKRTYQAILQKGSDAPMLEGESPETFFEMMGLSESAAFDLKAGGGALKHYKK